jgi:hypothetical protein
MYASTWDIPPAQKLAIDAGALLQRNDTHYEASCAARKRWQA